jgi:hypothetical protein
MLKALMYLKLKLLSFVDWLECLSLVDLLEMKMKSWM